MAVHLPSFYFSVFLVRDMLHEITQSQCNKKEEIKKLGQLCGSKFFNSLLDVYLCLSFGLWNCWLEAFGKNRIDTLKQVEGINVQHTLIQLKAKYPKERWGNYSDVVKGGQLTTP